MIATFLMLSFHKNYPTNLTMPSLYYNKTANDVRTSEGCKAGHKNMHE